MSSSNRKYLSVHLGKKNNLLLNILLPFHWLSKVHWNMLFEMVKKNNCVPLMTMFLYVICTRFYSECHPTGNESIATQIFFLFNCTQMMIVWQWFYLDLVLKSFIYSHINDILINSTCRCCYGSVLNCMVPMLLDSTLLCFFAFPLGKFGTLYLELGTF